MNGKKKRICEPFWAAIFISYCLWRKRAVCQQGMNLNCSSLFTFWWSVDAGALMERLGAHMLKPHSSFPRASIWNIILGVMCELRTRLAIYLPSVCNVMLRRQMGVLVAVWRDGGCWGVPSQVCSLQQHFSYMLEHLYSIHWWNQPSQKLQYFVQMTFTEVLKLKQGKYTNPWCKMM